MNAFDAQAVAQQMFALGLEEDQSDTEPSAPARVPGQVTAVQAPPQAQFLPYTLTDLGNADLFASLHRDRFRHVEGMGWHVWEEYRWKRIGGEKAAIRAAGRMAANIPDHDPTGRLRTRDLARHRTRSMSTTGIKAFLTQAKASEELSLDADVLDGNPYALCTPGGVVDLRTGQIRRPDPAADLHSRATTITPESMPTPRWDTFLLDTFGDDADGKEMIDFLQLLLGYSITGDVGAQVLPFAHGPGANGKSALMDVMLQLLGDYADAAPPGFLMDRKFAEHSTELTELHGRRIVVCSELRATDKWDESRVKLLTGGDKIKARRMRQDYCSWTPTHHLWLLGNHKPEVTSGGFAFWRRIRLLPFERVVAEDRKIDNLARLLVEEEGPGILFWLVEGARTYLRTRDPLDGPARVRLATTAYAATEDHIGRFLKECCIQGEDTELRVEQAALYTAYRDWCLREESGVRVSSARLFATRVRTERSLASPEQMIRSNGKKYYPGIALLPD